MCPWNALKKQGLGLIPLPREFSPKGGIRFSVEAVLDLTDTSSLTCLLLDFSGQFSHLKECTHRSVKCFMLDIDSDIIIALERITFIMNSEWELINKLVADGIRKKFSFQKSLNSAFCSWIMWLCHCWRPSPGGCGCFFDLVRQFPGSYMEVQGLIKFWWCPASWWRKDVASE